MAETQVFHGGPDALKNCLVEDMPEAELEQYELGIELLAHMEPRVMWALVAAVVAAIEEVGKPHEWVN